MAILSITDSGFAGNLKNYYSKFRTDQFNMVTKLFAQFEKIKPGGPSNMRWGGNGAIFDTIVSDPVPGTFSSAGYFPESVFRDEVQMTVGIARGYVRKQYDKLAMVGTSNKQAAFLSLAQKIDKEVRDDYRQMMQSVLHGAGTGTLAIVESVNSGTSYDIYRPYGITLGGQGGLWVKKGQKIAMLDTSAADAVLSTPLVVSVTLKTSPDIYTVVVDTTNATVAAGDKIVAASSTGNSFGAVPNGLVNITNRAAGYDSLHGQTAATYTRWDATRLTAGTDTPRVEQLLEDDLVELIMRVAGKSGHDARENPDEFVFVTTPGLKKSYVQQFLGQREISIKETSTKLRGGYTTDATCNGVAIIDDPHCVAGTVYLVHKPSIGWVDAMDFGGAVREDGDSPWRWVTDRDAWETTSSIYFNIATLQRNAHGSIVGYTDTNRYSPLAA